MRWSQRDHAQKEGVEVIPGCAEEANWGCKGGHTSGQELLNFALASQS